MRISDWSSDVCSSDLEAHARAAGRAPELQLAAHALEALDDRAAVLRLGIAARILIDDPPVAPDFVAPAGAANGAGANGDRFVVLDRSQPLSGQRRGEQLVGAQGAGPLQQRGDRGKSGGQKGTKLRTHGSTLI